MNDQERGLRLMELRTALEGSAPLRLGHVLKNFDDSLKIVGIAATDLDTAIEPFHDPLRSAALWAMQPNHSRPALDWALLNVSCRVCSFLASGVAAVEYTRKACAIARRVDKTLIPDYEKRLNAVRTRPPFSLLEFLRGLGLHVRIHSHGARFTTASGGRTMVYLNREAIAWEAAEDQARNDKARRAMPFIPTLPEEINVILLVKIFKDETEDFFDWFGRELEAATERAKSASPEFLEYRELCAREIEMEQSGGRISKP